LKYMITIESLTKRFGGLTAVNDVTLSVPEKSILGLIGVNGSGKTTIMNCICGLLRPSSGRILLHGNDISGWGPHEVALAGVGRTFQLPRLFRRMTLMENMIVPALSRGLSAESVARRASEQLESVDLYRLRDNHAEELSGGQQKLLELLRLQMFDAKLVLLDEPFAGVHPDLCRIFIAQILRMRELGATFILVSHDLSSVYALSNEIAVLNEGRVIAKGSSAEIRNNSDVIEAFLGQ
jgi:branched-chain amino acid transport system ATP-binding protein